MTLLLGPPSSGKTTLLLALAGKLDSALKVKILNKVLRDFFIEDFMSSMEFLADKFLNFFPLQIRFQEG